MQYKGTRPPLFYMSIQLYKDTDSSTNQTQ